MAIQDDCIRKNPFEFKLSDVLEDDTEQKVILTPEQEERLLAFMEKDKIYSKYYDCLLYTSIQQPIMNNNF